MPILSDVKTRHRKANHIEQRDAIDQRQGWDEKQQGHAGLQEEFIPSQMGYHFQ